MKITKHINRKHFPSIILQAVCDHKKRFTDCFASFPGSVLDTRVFENSDLKSRINSNPFSMVPHGSSLVGDATYTLEPYMMTPYKDTGVLNASQRNYNYKHSVTRNIIERAFTLLKSRFPRLKLVELKNMEELCSYIIAVCTLHNFALYEEIRLGDEGDYDFEIEEEEEINNFISYGSSAKDSERKRSDIAKAIRQ